MPRKSLFLEGIIVMSSLLVVFGCLLRIISTLYLKFLVHPIFFMFTVFGLLVIYFRVIEKITIYYKNKQKGN